MSKNIQKLFDISKKKTRSIIGLMSGTSIDGLDIALCHFKGSGIRTEVEVSHFLTLDYTDEIKTRIRNIFSKEEIKLQELCIYHSWLGDVMGKMVMNALKEWNIEPVSIDCIASHGQTIYHAPHSIHGDSLLPNATLQIGDADHIARKTGIVTISDFRQKHTAAGGEGAPLSAYGDYMLFNKEGEQRIFLNIGGIGNFTYLDGLGRPENLLSTDTGPGNTLIDAVIRKYYDNKSFDNEGRMAASGKINEHLLEELMSHKFFKFQLPKTTGPEIFNLEYVDRCLQNIRCENIQKEDLIATLTLFTVKSISKTIDSVINRNRPFKIYVSGGGLRNSTMIRWLKDELDGGQIISSESLGIHPDAKEAVLFALFANETLTGKGIPFKKQNGEIEYLTLGKISFPN